MNQVIDLVPIWTFILGMAVFFYVLLDRFDLGVECCSASPLTQPRATQS
jgi:cytochrome bd-type quinol oxidase subunit 2